MPLWFYWTTDVSEKPSLGPSEEKVSPPPETLWNARSGGCHAVSRDASGAAFRDKRYIRPRSRELAGDRKLGLRRWHYGQDRSVRAGCERDRGSKSSEVEPASRKRIAGSDLQRYFPGCRFGPGRFRCACDRASGVRD